MSDRRIILLAIGFVIAGTLLAVILILTVEAAPLEKSQANYYIPWTVWTDWHKITESYCLPGADCWVTGCSDLFCLYGHTFNVTIRAYNAAVEGRYCRFGGLQLRRYTKWECRW